MAISYKKLWKLLIDKDMTAVDLRLATGIAPNTMTKLRRDEEVSMTVLVKICTAPECQYWRYYGLSSRQQHLIEGSADEEKNNHNNCCFAVCTVTRCGCPDHYK